MLSKGDESLTIDEAVGSQQYGGHAAHLQSSAWIGLDVLSTSGSTGGTTRALVSRASANHGGDPRGSTAPTIERSFRSSCSSFVSECHIGSIASRSASARGSPFSSSANICLSRTRYAFNRALTSAIRASSRAWCSRVESRTPREKWERWARPARARAGRGDRVEHRALLNRCTPLPTRRHDWFEGRTSLGPSQGAGGGWVDSTRTRERPTSRHPEARPDRARPAEHRSARGCQASERWARPKARHRVLGSSLERPWG